jgi:hypothetical protein
MNRFVSLALWCFVIGLVATSYFVGFGQTFHWLVSR